MHHPFKMYGSMVLGILTELYNYQQNLIPEQFHHPKNKLHTHYESHLVPPVPVVSTLATTHMPSLPILDLSYRSYNHTFHINRIIY